MAVQFIIGSAGAGKSHKLYTMLTERAVSNVGCSYIALVPEQYSMESQKEIVNIHPKGGAFNIEVVSFNRLALQVFEEMGHEDVKLMDELGKVIVLRKVLEDCKNDLSVYSKKVSMPGFVDKIKSTVSELQQYDISIEKINEMINLSDSKPSLKHKLNDISIIYKQFLEYIQNNNITQEEVLNIFCKYIPDSAVIRDSEFFVDGFTGFTPIQMKVVNLLIKHAKNVTFAFTLPGEETEYTKVKEQELFALSKKTIKAIKSNCVDEGITVYGDIVMEKITVDGQLRPYRMRESKEISHVEANIFRYSDSKVYEEECNDISLHVAKNPKEEARYVASSIAKEMMDEKSNLRYRDIAVITGDMQTYHRYLEEAFEEYNIPCFIDYKRNINTNPFVDAIKAVVDIVYKDFSYESVFHFLRLGVADFEIAHIDLFENYVLMSGKRGFNSYTKKWEKLYKGLSDEELQIVNETKDRLVDIIRPLKVIINNKQATVKDKVEELYKFTVAIGMQGKLLAMGETFRKCGELSKVSEYNQIYDNVLQLFDKIVELMGNEKLSIKELKGILDSGFDTLKVGIIPPAVDSVMVGDIERTRLKDVKKIIYLLGANDGIIPKKNDGSGIISDMEREFLQENKYSLAPTTRENAFTQRLYLYAALTKPANKISISYSKVNVAGEEIRKSYLVSIIQKMFRNITIQDEELNSSMADRIYSKKEARAYVANNLKEFRKGITNNEFLQTYSVLKENKDESKFLDSMLGAAFYGREDERLSQATAKALYGLKDNIGITRIERYAKCAYAQFVANGLKLNQRRQYELAAFDLGNLYHYSIERFCKEINAQGIKWQEINDSKRKEMVSACVKNVIEEYDNNILTSSARYKYLADRVEEMTDKTVKVLAKQLSKGEFEPKFYEMNITHGRIDRVDIYEQDDRMYVKVIDYKSGKNVYSIEDTYYGIQLQLMIYLKEAISRTQRLNPEKKVMPGGAFYYSIQNPVIDKPDFEKKIPNMRALPEYEDYSDEMMKELIAEDTQFAEFRMSGLVNKNEEVLGAMDKEALEHRTASNIIPVKYTKNGIDARSTNVVSEETFNAVLNYAGNKADMLQQEIIDGNINVNPTKDACTYCQFKGICRFDASLGDKCKDNEKVKREEIIEEMISQYQKDNEDSK